MSNEKKIFFIKITFFLILCLIIFYRSPYILLNGRFVSEEGFFWFKNSFENGPLFGFFQIHFGAAYFNLWANIGSVLALVPPLKLAPFATVYLSLFLKLYILIYILKSDSIFIKTLKDRFLMCLILIISPPMVPEIWLNTLNSQSYFGILTVFIFFQNYNNKNLLNKISPYVLLISGLSTLYSAILAPFFLIKYIYEKNKQNFYNFIFISSAAFFQFCILAYSKFNNLIFEQRAELSIDKIISYVYNVIAKSIIGRETSQFILKRVLEINSVVLLTIALSILISLLLLFLVKKKDYILSFLIYIFVIESFLVIIGSWYNEVQGRYAVVSGVLLILIVYRLHQINFGFIKFFFTMLFSYSIIVGAYEFKIKAKYPEFLDCINCPIWKEEISKWEKNSEYEIQIWNYPGKSMFLNK